MKTDLTTSGTLLQSKARTNAGSMPISKDAKTPEVKKPIKAETSPDYKLDLSLPKTPPVPSAPSTPDVPKPQAKDVVVEKAKEEIKTHAPMPVEIKSGTQKKPAIIFLKGLDVFSSPSKSEGGYAGVGRMAESVEGSRMYGWDQKNEVIKEIQKVHPDYPVILVGHSLGGDTAVEIANAMDSLENNFRPIDLLITIDSVGFNNDIIPQNVKNHLNIFGENDFFLNDGPHVARRNEKTKVNNLLSPKDHTQLDDEKDIQYEVVNLIQKTLKGIS